MASRWQDLKRKMRNTVHEGMYRDAFLLFHASASRYFYLKVRGPHHRKHDDVGGLLGEPGFAERVSLSPRFIVNRKQLAAISAYETPLLINAILTLEPGEAYRIGQLLPADDEWQGLEVVRLDDEDCADLPYPSTLVLDEGTEWLLDEYGEKFVLDIFGPETSESLTTYYDTAEVSDA